MKACAGEVVLAYFLRSLEGLVDGDTDRRGTQLHRGRGTGRTEAKTAMQEIKPRGAGGGGGGRGITGPGVTRGKKSAKGGGRWGGGWSGGT